MKSRKNKIKRPRTYYDFSDLEKDLREVRPEFRYEDKIEQTIRSFPWGLFFWMDIDPKKSGTWHKGKKLAANPDWHEEREKFIDYLKKKYTIKNKKVNNLVVSKNFSNFAVSN